MRMTTNILAATIALVLILGFPPAACAVLINTSSDGTWKVSLIDGTFEQNQLLLEQQKWWRNKTLASEFALLVGASLGTHDSSGATLGNALFSYAVLTGGSPRNASARMLITTGDPQVQLYTTGIGWNVLPGRYAVATTVSEPAVFRLMLLGLSVLVGFSVNKRSAM